MIVKIKKAIKNPRLLFRKIKINFFLFPTLNILVNKKCSEIKKFTHLDEKSRLTIITAYNQNYKNVGDICSSQIKKYCKLHGYSYILFETENLTSRPYPWNKILFLCYALNNVPKSFIDSWIMWIDADAFIINDHFNLFAEIIQRVPQETELIITKDIYGLNTGVMIMKNSAFIKKFLKKIWSMRIYIDHPWWEQAAFINLLDKNWNGFRHRTYFVQQSMLNAYTYGLYDKSFPDGELNRDSFIYHIPGAPMPIKIHNIEKVLHAERYF